MKGPTIISAFLTIGILMWTMISPPSSSNVQSQAEQSFKYQGKGFGADLQNVFEDAINDAAIFYKSQFHNQTNYIWKKLNGTKQGDWKVMLIFNISISKVTEVSTGFYYLTQDDTWALWYNTSTFAKNTLYLVIYSGNNGLFTTNISTLKYTFGDVVNQTLMAIDSIVMNLNTAQDIGRYAKKYDSQQWAVITVPVEYAGTRPQTYSTLAANNRTITYTDNVTIVGVKCAMIMYV